MKPPRFEMLLLMEDAVLIEFEIEVGDEPESGVEVEVFTFKPTWDSWLQDNGEP